MDVVAINQVLLNQAAIIGLLLQPQDEELRNKAMDVLEFSQRIVQRNSKSAKAALKPRVSEKELQEIYNFAYLSRCSSFCDIDGIIIKALMDYLDIRQMEVNAWQKKEAN